jgi:hypothetical protein
MSLRKLGTLVAIMCAAILVVPVAAGAQTPAKSVRATSLTSIPLKGTVQSNGKSFTGRYTVDRFVTRNGKAYAIGTVTGKIGNRSVSKSNVAIPAKVARSTSSAKAAATCPVLHLDLGPLNLNLLGLTVHLNQVVLDINAVSGPGNLLGNLLCGVANLLNGNSLLGNQIAPLLNIVNQLLGAGNLLTL